ncbi:MAG: polysaccharide lyase family protein [Acidobacteriaceae bacterium]
MERRQVPHALAKEEEEITETTMRLKTAVLLGSIACILPACGTTPAKAQTHSSNAVFTIGAFDRSSAGFAGAPGFLIPPEALHQPVDYVVGKSNPGKDWPANQRVALAANSAEQNTKDGSAPRAIQFSLTGVPAAMYRLRIAVLIENPTVPTLNVTINGKHGTFYLHPKLDYSNGDQADSFDGDYSNADVSFDFPGSYLHSGTNTITLQAVEDAEKVPADAELTYDAIELERGQKGAATNNASALIEPTIFYKQQQDRLKELVDVFVRSGGAIQPGSSAELTIAGQQYRQTIQNGADFGEAKFEFPVSEFPAHTEAQIKWNVSGHSQHQKQLIAPQKKWTLFLVPHIHLDVGYSDYQAKVAAIQSRVIDEAMHLTAQHPDFRFSLDGYWPLEQFLKTRTPAEQQRVITAIQKQQLFLPAQYASLLTGFPTAETLIRSLYPSANFSREHGTPFNYANITDVPSFTWSYASILASSGIHELFSGSDNYRAPVLLQGRLNENSPFWWEGPDGKKVLLWYSRHYMQMQIMFGLPPLVSAGHDTIPLLLQMYELPSYHANATILFGTQVENTDLYPQQAELAKQWNSVYAYPHMQYSGFHAALQNIAKQFGDTIPTISGDGGPYWEDGIGSDAYYAAMERENESRGPSAEKLSTLTSLVNPKLAADKADLNRMWTDMVLMDEHTWDSYNSISDPTSMEAVQQLQVKDLNAIKAQDLGRFVIRNSMASLVDSISAGRGNLVVFNTLNWKRNGLVALDLAKDREIVDPATGKVEPVETLWDGKDFRHVRFVAQDIPAVGYKVYQLRPTEQAPASATSDQTTTLESPYYRVRLDPTTGAVQSIYDKQLQQELVNQESPYRFGQYLYVTGGDKSPSTVLLYSHVYPKPDLQIHGATNGRLISVTHTPYGTVARMESTDTNTPRIVTEIQLFDHQKKIEFTEEVNKKEVNSKEAVYFAFPFSMDHPQFQYEIQNGVVDPSKDMYPGAGHEWFSVQHWVSAQQNGVSATIMPLDASLVTLGDINRGEWPEKFGQRPGTIFSYVMNNYWFTNYRAGQGGHFRFRYVLTSAPRTDAAQLSHMGWEAMTPLEENEITSQDKALDLPGPLNGKQSSFLKADDPNLVLDTWKPAEDGKGTILRFIDLGGAERTVNVQTPLFHLDQAWQTDAVERNQHPLSLVGTNEFQLTVHPHEILTVRIIASGGLQPPAQ